MVNVICATTITQQYIRESIITLAIVDENVLELYICLMLAGYCCAGDGVKATCVHITVVV